MVIRSSSVWRFFVGSCIYHLYQSYAPLALAPDCHIGRFSLLQAAMVFMARQFGIIRPLSTYWSGCFDFSNQLEQDLANSCGEPFSLLFRFACKLNCPLHIIYQFIVSGKRCHFLLSRLITFFCSSFPEEACEVIIWAARSAARCCASGRKWAYRRVTIVLL